MIATWEEPRRSTPGPLAGLRVLEVRAREHGKEDAARVHALLGPLMHALGVDPARLAAQLRALQYVVRADKPVTQ